ncbi:MAG TPA: RNA 2'-phosphotransferase [Saprospiraceae bacterium]|nr:RNA 2'-phosphotransferase [Saprospiraceae bacterium]
MSKKENIKISKFLSLVLRHKPETIQIQLDENGWVSVSELIEKLNQNREYISFEILKYVVDTNSKKRFAFNEDQTKIRASQGHSLQIDLNYEPINPPKKLYHGTSERFLESILKSGIEKRNRQHVHLSSDIETALKVGQRHGKPVVLDIEAEKMSQNGHKFYLSDNSVWLTEYVPIEYINSSFGTAE